MKKNKLHLLLICVSFFSLKLDAQQVYAWPNSISGNNANLKTEIDKIEHYFDSTGLDTVQGSGYAQFRRWRDFWVTRTAPQGSNNYSIAPAMEEIATVLSNNAQICGGSGIYNEDWKFIGHTQTTGTTFSRGQGVLIKVFVDDKNDPSLNTIYVGSPSGGLWKTINAKSTNPTWDCVTNNLRLPGLGINDILVMPPVNGVTSNTIFISTSITTGQIYNGGGNYGMGLLKTTDGGQTWSRVSNVSYDLSAPSSLINTQGVFLHPGNSQILFVFKDNQIYKSTDGGNNFNAVYTSANSKTIFRDLEFIPPTNSNDPWIILVTGVNGEVIRSTNEGSTGTWSDISSNFTLGVDKKLDIGFSINFPDLVYISEGSKMWKSSNKGVTWSSYTINHGGFRFNYFYNDFVLSPDNNSIMYHAGNMVSKSTNEGANFNSSYGYYSGTVHPDVNDLEIRKDGQGNDIIWCANDGGINVSYDNGSTWKNLNGTGLNITQVYGVDMNPEKDFINVGCQDLGIYTYNNGSWINTAVGDGYFAFYNHHTNKMFNSNQKYLFQVDRYGVTSNSTLKSMKFGVNYIGRMYMGFNTALNVMEPTSNVATNIYNFTSGGYRLYGMGVSKSDANVLYMGMDHPTWTSSKSNRLYKSTNAKSTSISFTDLGVGSNLTQWWNKGISDIIVDPNNSNHVWICFGQYISDAQRIFFSSDGGTNWIGINKDLNLFPGHELKFPINVMKLDETTGGMYIGTDVGVYFNPNPKDANSGWKCFNQGLPVAIVSDMKIDYCRRTIVIATYGRGIWESKLADIAKIEHTITSTDLLTVAAGTTQIYFYDIIIPAGKTLTVQGTLKMASNTRIHVMPGAKVLIDGGLVTSFCSIPWKGFRVFGNKNLSQNVTTNQGLIEIKNNGTIENALNAVSLSSLDLNGNVNWNGTGGIIVAKNAIFRNNKRDVEFLSYHNKNTLGKEVSNRSYFENCQFLTTNTNNIPNNQFEPHVTMWDMVGISFKGCVFEDQRSNLLAKTQGRIGLYTMESSYLVTNSCLSGNTIPCSQKPSQFKKLKSAIQSYNNGVNGVIKIENSEFSSYKGALLQGTNNSVVQANYFYVNHDQYIQGITDYPFGLYLDKCQGFNTEGNHFIGTTGSTNVKNGGAAGLVIRNTGPNNNEFYRSYFENLKVASQALSENRNSNMTNGLSFRCNEYTQNWNDLDIREDVNNPSFNKLYLGMKELQGQIQGGAPITPSNLFGNSSNILNLNIENKGNYLQYIYCNSPIASNRLYPKLVTSNVLLLQLNASASTCPNNLSIFGTNKEVKYLKLDSIRPILLLRHNLVKGIVDGGNTMALKNLILNANISNIGFVVSQLMSYSPYLSNEILALIANQTSPFTNEMIRDILVANPHSSRCLETKTILDNRSNPLSQIYRDQIDSLVNVFTPRDSILAELSSITESYDLKLNELLYAFESDTLADLSVYSRLFKHPTNPSYHYRLAEKYFNLGDWNNYKLTKDSIPGKFNLDSREFNYHCSFVSFYNQLHCWQLSSGNQSFVPDSIQKLWLLNYVSTHSQFPVKAFALLALNDTLINFPDVYIQSGDSLNLAPNMLQNETFEKDNSSSSVILFPNPAKNTISLKWRGDFQNSVVSVTDLQGKTILKNEWSDGPELLINLEGKPNGVYFVRIYNTKNDKIIVRKLILNN